MQTQEKTDALSREVLTVARNALLVNLRFLDTALGLLPFTPRPGQPLATDGHTIFYDPRALLRAYRDEQSVAARDYLHLVLHCILRHFSVPDGANRTLWDLACDVSVEYAISNLGLSALSAAREARQQTVFTALLQAPGILTAEKLYRYYLSHPPDDMTLRDRFLADDHTLWRADVLPRWQGVAARVQVDMETFSQREDGALLQGLRAVTREKSDFSEFLRKFAARGERLKIDPDEFDYSFYAYGQQLYKDVLLIEPVEYRETRVARSFVLAVEIHGAVDAARSLVRQAWQALMATSHAHAPVRLYLLSNGTAADISARAALEQALERLSPAEETPDFRPAFRQTDRMLNRRELQNLKGLLYITDTPAPFPAQMPRYPAAFVFVRDDYSAPDVPPWAIRLLLQRDEIGVETNESE